jgi:hypothetical protein
MNKIRQNVSKFPVMPAQCSTCPFRTDANGRHPNVRLVNQLQLRCLTEGNHIFHHPRLKGKPTTHLCRGARDYQLQIFHRLGLLDTPTDAAWARAVDTLASRQGGDTA